MQDVRERLTSEAIVRNNDGDYKTRDFLREVRNDIERRGSGLFVIEQFRGDGKRCFWSCSAEHGCGWHPDHPKQAFTKSEVGNEVRLMIERGFFCTIVIRELVL